MIIDLHIHSRDGSDGRWSLVEIFREASARGIGCISITDHDSIHCQARALDLARAHGMNYLTGVELNVTIEVEGLGKPRSLDFLGYGYDPENEALRARLDAMRVFRQRRAGQILENLNREFARQGRELFTGADLEAIEATVDGAFGRPHIAAYLIKKGIVADRQEAFDRYLVKCDVPKMHLGLEEASRLIHDAGGVLMLAHPSDPNGTSLVAFSDDLAEQRDIFRRAILPFVDGIECWHSRLSEDVRAAWQEEARAHDLFMSGGSDCHQDPVLMGTAGVPEWVAGQFDNLLLLNEE